MKNSYYYKGANPTVDLLLISPENKILLVLRKKEAQACPDMWAIPGGFVDTDAKKHEEWTPGREVPEQAAFRELVEETGIAGNLLDKNRLQFTGIYEGNNRDPRDNLESWSKSHAFSYTMTEDERHIINTVKNINDGVDLDDVADTKWFTLEEVSNIKLAFDHNKIISDTILKLNNKPKKLKK
jgi:8-oxo-dGTP diphosphatase